MFKNFFVLPESSEPKLVKSSRILDLLFFVLNFSFCLSLLFLFKEHAKELLVTSGFSCWQTSSSCTTSEEYISYKNIGKQNVEIIFYKIK